MSEIVVETEKHIHYAKRFRNNDFKIKNRVDAISHATCGMAIDIDAKAIVVTSISGMTVRMVSRFRAPTDIIGMATNKAVWYKLALSWGVLPVLSEQFTSTDVLFYHALRAAKENLEYTKQAHPRAQAKWFDAAKRQYGSTWIRKVKAQAGGGRHGG